jgi:hypothetical protein
VAIDDYNGFDQNSAKILSEYLTWFQMLGKKYRNREGE